jgi:hypothetical protein
MYEQGSACMKEAFHKLCPGEDCDRVRRIQSKCFNKVKEGCTYQVLLE